MPAEAAGDYAEDSSGETGDADAPVPPPTMSTTGNASTSNVVVDEYGVKFVDVDGTMVRRTGDNCIGHDYIGHDYCHNYRGH